MSAQDCHEGIKPVQDVLYKSYIFKYVSWFPLVAKT